MQQQRLVIFSPQGEKISCILTKAHKFNPQKTVLYGNCFTCTKNYKGGVYFSRSLASRGWSTLRFDYRGLGESDGDFKETTFFQMADDIAFVYNYMEREGFPPKIYLGHSIGGTLGLYITHRLKSLAAMVLLASTGNLINLYNRLGGNSSGLKEKGYHTLEIGGRKYELTSKFFASLQKASQTFVLERHILPTVIFHYEGDPVLPYKESYELYQKLASPFKNYILLAGKD
ncbi:MAG: alpha/beta fold hydrolase, partial [Planctomycetota bacterium]